MDTTKWGGGRYFKVVTIVGCSRDSYQNTRAQKLKGYPLGAQLPKPTAALVVGIDGVPDPQPERHEFEELELG